MSAERAKQRVIDLAIAFIFGPIIAVWLVAQCAEPSPAFAQTRIPACDVDYALYSRDTLWVYVELRKPPARICVLDLAGRKVR